MDVGPQKRTSAWMRHALASSAHFSPIHVGGAGCPSVPPECPHVEKNMGRPVFFSTCGHSGGTEGHPAPPTWMGEKCAELANACRIQADVRFWGPTSMGTDKAVNAMASYNGSYSHAGAWPDPDLIYSYA